MTHHSSMIFQIFFQNGTACFMPAGHCSTCMLHPFNTTRHSINPRLFCIHILIQNNNIYACGHRSTCMLTLFQDFSTVLRTVHRCTVAGSNTRSARQTSAAEIIRLERLSKFSKFWKVGTISLGLEQTLRTPVALKFSPCY